MPTNVTPEFKRAKDAFRHARDPDERLVCLKEMLRTIPKHKGTEHLQADIKTRIKELTAELAGPRKGGARTGPTHAVRPEGAAQVALVGPPNAGKSALHTLLTGSHAEVAPYPNTTHAPLPGMMPYKDVHFQLVDLPPVSVSFMEPWMPNALQPAHAALLVVDVAAPGCAENIVYIQERLQEKRIRLVPDWGGVLAPGPLERVMPLPSERPDTPLTDAEEDDPFGVELPTLLVANKSDVSQDPEDILALEELIGVSYPSVFVSATTGKGTDLIGDALFHGLGVVRVYTKTPGHPPDMKRPYTVFAGTTIHAVASLIHKDMAETLRHARIWGSGRFDGQQVGKEHVLEDGDVVELHTS